MHGLYLAKILVRFSTWTFPYPHPHIVYCVTQYFPTHEAHLPSVSYKDCTVHVYPEYYAVILLIRMLVLIVFYHCLQIQEERERRHREADMLETHIMQAQAAATAADERELQRASEGCDKYHSLGLPPSTYDRGS